ncbi:MAG: glycogen synthase GlgA [Bryobacteraceae bacterium]|nr:glycogen synthase GlgA [Bryobacteraceae bacterium]
MSKILMVASEAVPLVKTGGLADVVGSLPPALANRGHEVAVVLPRYSRISLDGAAKVYDNLPILLGGPGYRTDIFTVHVKGVPYFLVDCPPLFDRDGIYDSGGWAYGDNHIRFAVLCRAALEIARRMHRPQILHCHDWQASLVAVYLRHSFRYDPTFVGMRCLLTLHNLGYQGHFGREILPYIGLDDSLYRMDLLEFHGMVNYLKGGIVYSDAINTVSRGYAAEIQRPEYGFGLDGLLRARSNALTGILNGADYDEWNPETDPLIAANYSARDLTGKRISKRALLEELRLPTDNLDRPVIGIVSRLANQKGFDLIEPILGALMGEDLQLVVLGKGDPHYEWAFSKLAGDHPHKVATWIGYRDDLAHRIEAGADMFLMPSLYEPCGLSQIYSLRYGTVPIVRATGGLADTIDPSVGFPFHDYTPQALLDTIRAALRAFGDKPAWQETMRRGMARDYSWKTAAAAYSELYARMLP